MMEDDRTKSVRFTLRRKIVFTLAALVTLAVGAEVFVRAVCRAIGRAPYTMGTPWCVADDDLFYVFRPNFEGKIYQDTARINNASMRGPDISVQKPAGTLRVLCLGDSRTFGFSVAQEESYPARLEQILRERHPHLRVEILNAGTHGYTSYQGLRYLELRGLRFEPDIVTVAFGANDRRFVLKPEQADGREWFREGARSLRWRSQMRFSYAILAVLKVAGHLSGERSWAKDVVALPSQRLDKLKCRVDAEPYKEHLRAIAQLCRRSRIGVVLVDASDAPPIERVFEEGQRLREQGHHEEAVNAFSRIWFEPTHRGSARWYKALALYEIGLTREAQGRTSEALAAFRHSAQQAAFWSVMGGTPIRHRRQYSEALRAAAKELDVPAVDAAEKFAGRPEMFCDYWHFSAEGHRVVAEALADCFVEHQLLPPAENQGQSPK